MALPSRTSTYDRAALRRFQAATAMWPLGSARCSSYVRRKPAGESPMTIKVGDKVPAATFTTFGPDGPGPLSTDQLFSGKKVALFAVPGAFTPTCSAKHLPSFKEHVADFKAKGVDTIACVSV